MEGRKLDPRRATLTMLRDAAMERVESFIEGRLPDLHAEARQDERQGTKGGANLHLRNPGLLPL